jgi:molecular chaperone DnaJ
MKKDYYSILGVSKDATDKEIKSAYRELAKKWHPDLFSTKSEAEQKEAQSKFQDIGEAYSVLSDKDKRAKYDNPMSGFEFDGRGFDPFEMMERMKAEFMGGFGHDGGGPRVQKGGSLRIKIDLTLKEVYNGIDKKTIKYKRNVLCEHCGGSGAKDSDSISVCQHCGGTGSVLHQNGMMQVITTCPHCRGIGKVITAPCNHCGGSGFEEKIETVEISVPKGVDDGMQMQIGGMGHLPKGNGVNGDLLIVFHVVDEGNLSKNGNNLVMALDVPVLDALTGCEMKIKTINDKEVKLKIPPCSPQETTFKMKGYGLPYFQNEHLYGDLFIVINIVFPKKIDKKEIDLINEIKKQENFKI